MAMASFSSSGAPALHLPSAGTATYSVNNVQRHPLLQFPTFSGKSSKPYALHPPSLLDTYSSTSSGQAGLQRWRLGCGGGGTEPQKRSGGWRLELNGGAFPLLGLNGEFSFKQKSNSNSQMMNSFRSYGLSVNPLILLLFLMVKNNKTLLWALGICILLNFFWGKATPSISQDFYEAEKKKEEEESKDDETAESDAADSVDRML